MTGMEHSATGKFRWVKALCTIVESKEQASASCQSHSHHNRRLSTENGALDVTAALPSKSCQPQWIMLGLPPSPLGCSKDFLQGCLLCCGFFQKRCSLTSNWDSSCVFILSGWRSQPCSWQTYTPPPVFPALPHTPHLPCAQHFWLLF